MKPEAIYPIQEFKEKPRRDKVKPQPTFLYDPNYPNPRIVEFYAQ
jgi:hypothetical protein